MLATEETKTVYKDTTGKEYTTRELAEAGSMHALMRKAMGRDYSLALLLSELEPDAKAWLLRQLGEQPIGEPFLPATYNYEFLAQEATSATYSATQQEYQKIAARLKKLLAPYTVPVAQPQQEVSVYTAAQVLETAYDNAAFGSSYSGMYRALQQLGYKLVKA